MKKIRILVVEDELIVSRHIRNALEKSGFSVTSAVASGEEALVSIGKKKPDLVLMDIKLKGKMTGIQAAKKIYKENRIPVIFLTAYANPKLIQMAKKSEPFGYLVKPFDETGLKTSIEIALYKSRMHDKLRKAHDSLETKVMERTAELQATNAALEQEISERKKAEESKRKILEDLNDRMKELTSVSYSAKILKNEMLRSQLEHSHMQEAKHKIFEALQERVKEITLLRNMTKLLQNYRRPQAELVEEIVSIIPLGWKYPDIAAARLVYDDREISTPNFTRSRWKQSADFKTDDGKIGVLEVHYLEEMPEEFEGPFLLEERNLINSLALMLKFYFNSEAMKTHQGHSVLFDHYEHPVWYLKDPETLGLVNRAFEIFYGKSRKELENRKISEVFPDEMAEGLISGIRKAFEEGKTVETSSVLSVPGGTKKNFSLKLVPVPGNGGQPAMVVCIARME